MLFEAQEWRPRWVLEHYLIEADSVEQAEIKYLKGICGRLPERDVVSGQVEGHKPHGLRISAAPTKDAVVKEYEEKLGGSGLVRDVAQVLYFDPEKNEYTSDKVLSGADVIQDLAEVFQKYNLLPD